MTSLQTKASKRIFAQALGGPSQASSEDYLPELKAHRPARTKKTDVRPTACAYEESFINLPSNK